MRLSIWAQSSHFRGGGGSGKIFILWMGHLRPLSESPKATQQMSGRTEKVRGTLISPACVPWMWRTCMGSFWLPGLAIAVLHWDCCAHPCVCVNVHTCAQHARQCTCRYTCTCTWVPVSMHARVHLHTQCLTTCVCASGSVSMHSCACPHNTQTHACTQHTQTHMYSCICTCGYGPS